MTSADREKFFRSKLFPSEEESDSEVDEDTTKQLHSPVGTESEDLHDVACKGQKRKLSERDGHQSLAPNSGVSLQNEESTPSYSSQQLYTVEKPVLFSSPRSLRVSQDLSPVLKNAKTRPRGALDYSSRHQHNRLRNCPKIRNES